MEEKSFGVLVESSGEQWGELKREIEELQEQYGHYYTNQVRIFLGHPAEMPEAEDILVVESDVQRWATAMRTGIAVLVSPAGAFWHQAKVVLNVAYQMTYPQRREAALFSLTPQQPWSRGSANEEAALQLTLATFAARTGLAEEALRHLAEAESSEPALQELSSSASAGSREESVTIDRCLGAVQAFANSANASSVGHSRASDEELMIWFFEKQDREASRELLRRYGNVIFRFAFRVVADEVTAAKICEEVFFEAFQTAKNRPRKVWPKTWFLSLATQRAREVIKAGDSGWRGWSSRPPLEYRRFASAIDESSLGTDTHAIGLRQLEYVLELMSPYQRAVVLMRRQHGISDEQIARAFGYSVTSIKVQYSQAYEVLRLLGDGKLLPFRALQ